jgi:hypothetical protein
MIEFVFTLDYEVYGNGEGSLRDLVYEPTEKLMGIFRERKMRFVAFVEVAEMEMIEAKGTDRAIDLVKNQIQDLHREGFEIGLHLHPQWYNAQYANGGWLLDYGEYNLCTLPRERIAQIADRSIAYLRNVLGTPDVTPLSFRAGNWLFQPTPAAAQVLAGRGIKVDSSVFKGGVQHGLNLDYRRALRNGYYWKFMDDINVPDAKGALLEIPIHTQMVPTWKMATRKRVGLQRTAAPAANHGSGRLSRLLDFGRLQYPLKLDFCRMTLSELTGMVDAVIAEDRLNQTAFNPIVAIGHTKELVHFETVEAFLWYLSERNIAISTFREVYEKCK